MLRFDDLINNENQQFRYRFYRFLYLINKTTDRIISFYDRLFKNQWYNKQHDEMLVNTLWDAVLFIYQGSYLSRYLFTNQMLCRYIIKYYRFRLNQALLSGNLYNKNGTKFCYYPNCVVTKKALPDGDCKWE